MALSTEEEAKARVALREVKQVENFRKTFWFLIIFCLFYFAQAVAHIISGEKSWYVFAILYPALVLNFVRMHFKYKERYPNNVKFLSGLQEREDISFKKIEEEVYHPPALLDCWSRRLEQRAILWRVDRFLNVGRERG